MPYAYISQRAAASQLGMGRNAQQGVKKLINEGRLKTRWFRTTTGKPVQKIRQDSVKEYLEWRATLPGPEQEELEDAIAPEGEPLPVAPPFDPQPYVDKLLAECTPVQREAMLSPAKRKVWCCGRRGGKTSALVRYLLLVALTVPQSLSLYLAATQAAAKRLAWDSVKTGLPQLIRTLGIPEDVVAINVADMLITFWNGSQIRVSGFETRGDAARLKGDGYDLVVADEVQDIADDLLTYLQQTCVGPMLFDKKGVRVMAGTPGPTPVGFYWARSTGDKPGWESRTWTFKDNPHLPQDWLVTELRETGYTQDDPYVQREYFALWVHDENQLLYRYNPKWEFDPKSITFGPEWQHVLGIDPGFLDKSAFVLASYCYQKEPTVYVREAYQEGGADVTRVAEILKSYLRRYPGLVLVIDEAALQAAMELRNRHGLNLIAAKKSDKATYIGFMNDDLRRGRLRVDPEACKALIGQWNTVQIDPKFATDPKKRIEKPSAICDLADAGLYAWRHSYGYLYEAKLPPQQKQTLAQRIRSAHWGKDFEADMLERAEADPEVLRQQQEDEALFKELKGPFKSF